MFYVYALENPLKKLLFRKRTAKSPLSLNLVGYYVTQELNLFSMWPARQNELSISVSASNYQTKITYLNPGSYKILQHLKTKCPSIVISGLLF